jgi:hypothetical protein
VVAALPNGVPPVLVARGGKVAARVTVGDGVFVGGAASAVSVRPDAKVETASVRIALVSTFAVGVVGAAGVPPQAVNNRTPTITNDCTPVINLNLIISTPFNETIFYLKFRHD